ncbi:unnamed protein product [Nezara viridula]|uniref:Neuropeptide n=1 Tax=Nezara viridula TaxID=85310 RepID=A0A9P0MU04_NEZVI|nr:unnamed protein product [Nezara viridula]
MRGLAQAIAALLCLLLVKSLAAQPADKERLMNELDDGKWYSSQALYYATDEIRQLQRPKRRWKDSVVEDLRMVTQSSRLEQLRGPRAASEPSHADK